MSGSSPSPSATSRRVSAGGRQVQPRGIVARVQHSTAGVCTLWLFGDRAGRFRGRDYERVSQPIQSCRFRQLTESSRHSGV